ncbi:MAG: helix-turn-helix transcriptional regulator [Eubacterium sp.]
MNIRFSENVKKLRKKQDLTQEGLADLIGVSFQTVSKWERGESNPDIALLPVIADVFNTTIDDLLGADKAKNEQKIKKYLELYDQIRLKDRALAFTEFQKAVKEFPNDFRIIVRYMELLKEEKDHIYLPDYEKTSKQMMSIFEKIQSQCVDDSIRIWSKHLICEHLFYKYECCGYDEKYRKQALDILNTMPALCDSREYLSMMNTDLSSRYEIRENAIEELLYLLQNTIISYCYYDDKFTAEYKINVINHMNELFKIVDSDDNYSKNRIHMIYNYGHLGHLNFEIGNNEVAVKYLKIAAEYAKEFDENPNEPERLYRFFEKGEKFREMNMCRRMKELMTEHYHLSEDFKETDEFNQILSILE